MNVGLRSWTQRLIGRADLSSERQPNQRCILVLGMHRSGTSCLTGSLQKRGLTLGEVFTQNAFNAKGNRENRKVMGLNDEVLAASGGAWDRPPEQLSWSRGMERTRDRLITSLRRSAPQAWGFKDPRTLLTLPFWLEGLVDPQFVGTFRHPMSVARSLQNRGDIAIQNGIELWYQHNIRLIDLWERQPFPLLSFDVPAEEYEHSIIRAGDELGLSRSAADDSFFNDSLRHHLGDVDSHDLPEPSAQLYGRLREIYLSWRDQPTACVPA
jgi:hypothetical protein